VVSLDTALHSSVIWTPSTRHLFLLVTAVYWDTFLLHWTIIRQSLYSFTNFLYSQGSVVLLRSITSSVMHYWFNAIVICNFLCCKIVKWCWDVGWCVNWVIKN
jgi:hypothetical protein